MGGELKSSFSMRRAVDTNHDGFHMTSVLLGITVATPQRPARTGPQAGTSVTPRGRRLSRREHEASLVLWGPLLIGPRRSIP